MNPASWLPPLAAGVSFTLPLGEKCALNSVVNRHWTPFLHTFLLATVMAHQNGFQKTQNMPFEVAGWGKNMYLLFST